MRTPVRKNHGKITFVLYNKPYPCNGNCLFCFTSHGFTKSTTENEDTLLAKNSFWNGKTQLEKRFVNYYLKKNSGIKCDFAVKGDSFASHSDDYLREYTKELYDFLNGTISKSLEEAAYLQRFSKDKCVTFKVETRPDQIDEKKCMLFMELGITTVELGVQSLNNSVLDYNRRGHTTVEVINATKILRRFGFEVVYQMMVGLPGSTREIEKEIYTKTLWDDEFSPDAIKIYPCLLLKKEYAYQEKLRNLYLKGLWKPIDREDYLSFLYEISPFIPRFVHINRIQRIISEEKIAAGIKDEIDRNIFSSSIYCLWQRSIANKFKKSDVKINYSDIKIIYYPQGENRYCIEAILQEDILLGYARFDIVENKRSIIRDIRVLGNMLLVGQKNINKDCQHSGIGSSILKTIEQLAYEKGVKYIYVKPSFGTTTWFISKGFTSINKFYFIKGIHAKKGW